MDNCFDWIIIGGLTGHKYNRHDESIKKIIKGAKEFNIPLFIKDNLNWHENIKEFPK